jgi:hypothetical protein
MGKVRTILAHLRRSGLLLLQDKRRPSVVTLVVGRPISTSWWAHPEGRRIWEVLHELSEHEDVLPTRLIGRKVTFVHRVLWPALFGAGAAREPWQTAGLPAAARKLLRTLDKGGSLHASGKVAQFLAERLLVLAREVHTESGKHELLLETWQGAANRVGCLDWLAPGEGRRALADAAAAIGVDARNLPWGARRGT